MLSDHKRRNKRVTIMTAAIVLSVLFLLPANVSAADETETAASKAADTTDAAYVIYDFSNGAGSWKADENVSRTTLAACDDAVKSGACLNVRGTIDGDIPEFGITLKFDSPISLSSYKNIAVRLKPESADAGVCRVILTLTGSGEKEKYSLSLASGAWQTASFDIGSCAFLGRIDSVTVALGSDSYGENGFSLSRVYSAANAEAALTERFSSGDFSGIGSTVTPSDDNSLLTVSIGSANAALLIGRDGMADDGADAIRITLENDSDCTALTVYYNTENSNSYSYERSAVINIDPNSGKKTYTAPFPAKDANYLMLSFAGVSSGKLIFSEIKYTSAYFSGIDGIGEITSAVISEDGKYIVVRGNVGSDESLKYKNKQLALYELDPYENALDIRSKENLPTATVKMASRFEFRVPLPTDASTSLLSKYAVVLYPFEEESDTAASASLIFVDTPKYISNASDFAEYNSVPDSGTIKGVCGASPASALSAGAGKVIIDVALDSLVSYGSTGYLHSYSGAYYYYANDYVTSLDGVIGKYTAEGVEVYLRLLVTGNGANVLFASAPTTENAYRAISVNSYSAMLSLCAATDFLCARYACSGDSSIAGFVIGETADVEKYNYSPDASLSSCVLDCATALRLISGTAKRRNGALSFYIPLSDSYDADIAAEPYGRYNKSAFLSSLIRKITDDGPLEWHVLWESSRVPDVFAASDGASATKDELSSASEKGYIGAEDFGAINEVFDALADSAAAQLNVAVSYVQRPLSCDFMFNVPYGIDKKTLYAAYSFEYYKLRFTAGTQAYFISFSASEDGSAAKEQASYIGCLLKYIDTSRSEEYTADALAAYSLTGWSSVVAGFDAAKLDAKRLTEGVQLSELPADIIGKFQYFDFSTAHSSLGWYEGDNCFSLEYSQSDGALRAGFGSGGETDGEYGSILYKFAYRESFSSASVLVFDVAAHIGDDLSGQVELVVTFGGGYGRYEVTADLDGGLRKNIAVDLSDYPGIGAVRYIKLSVRPKTGSGEIALDLFGVTGYSDKFNDSSLESVIALERENAKKTDAETEKSGLPALWIAVIAGVVAVSVCVVVILTKKHPQYTDEK